MEKINLAKFKKIAFVASGGAAKALFYHIGVNLALKEHGVEISSGPPEERSPDRHYVSLLVGSSGGSIFGALAVNGFDEEVIETKLENKPLLSYFYNTRRRKKGDLTGFSYQDVFFPRLPSLPEMMDAAKRYMSIHRLREKYGPGIGLEALLRELIPPVAFFTLSRLEKYLNDVLPITDFEELHRKFGLELFVTATEVDYPRKAIIGHMRSDWIGTDDDNFYRDRYINGISIPRAVHASCAVPGLFMPVEIEGVGYYDGEVKKALSAHVAKDRGADLIFVSHTFTPYIRNGNMGSVIEMGLYSVVIQAFNTLIYQKIQTPKEFHEQQEILYDYVCSDTFRRKYPGLSDEKYEEFKKELCEKMNFNPDLKYIYFPSPNEIFFMDHFNMLPFATRELINIGYAVGQEVLAIHGIEKLPEYAEKGILEKKGLRRFKFERSRYEQYRKVMRTNYQHLV
ncbi:MAG: patatin-like phospholipase family protein [bacterium]